MRKWITMFSNGGCVKRFHTVPTIGTETVAEHSFGVAMLCIALTKHSPSTNLLKAALYHDLAEQATGDVPACTKWQHPFLKTCLDSIEEAFELEHSLNVSLTQHELLTLKWADMLHLLLYCRDQRLLGNRNMDTVFERGVVYLNGLRHHTVGHEVLSWLVSTYGE